MFTHKLNFYTIGNTWNAIEFMSRRVSVVNTFFDIIVSFLFIIAFNKKIFYYFNALYFVKFSHDYLI